MDRSVFSFQSMKPFVRFAQDIYILPNAVQKYVQAYDHRLFYIISGYALVKIEDIAKEISMGQVLYWKSGLKYRFQIHNAEPLHMIVINFDFTQNHQETVQYIPLAIPENFDSAKILEQIEFSDAPAMNSPIIVSDLSAVLPYMQEIVTEAANPAQFSNFQLSNLLSLVLTLVFRAASQRQAAQGHVTSYKQITDYIHSHYAEDLDNKCLAAKFSYHPKYISQLITQHTGTSLHQYLLKVRIRNAIYLLQTTQSPINEVARQVGFQNASYFSKYFRKCTGYSPGAFRIE